VTERRGGRAAPGTRSIRRFTLEQRIRYDYSGPVTDLRQYLRVVPPARHGAQRRRAWSLTVEGGGAAKVWSRLDAFANLTTTIDVPRVGGSIEFVVAVDAETDADRTGRPPTIAGAGPYLAPTRLTAADGRIAALGSGGDPAAICARVRGALTYEWGITGVHTTAVGALDGGRGVCQDYAHIMLAACRSAGVPARYVSGHLIGEGGSHAWVEVLRPDPLGSGRWLAEGWDPTHDRRTDGEYLVVAVGRDYHDAAPMWGSYEGDGVTGTLTVDKRLSVPEAPGAATPAPDEALAVTA
jgi:transglutaminase-like putative cysteine protease